MGKFGSAAAKLRWAASRARRLLSRSTAPSPAPSPRDPLPQWLRTGSEGIVLVGADFPPVHDHHSGGLRLKTLIEMIGKQGWPIVFASHVDVPELPGILATRAGRARYEDTLRGSGAAHIAYGMDETAAMLDGIGTNVRYALISFPKVARDFIPLVRRHCPHARIYYDMVDFHALRLARAAAVTGDASLLADAAMFREIETSNARAADVTVAISDEERSAMLECVPDAMIEVLPNVFEMPPGPPAGLSGRAGLLFVGGFGHLPNGDAAIWFVDRIWPHIRDAVPDCRFRIVGSNPSPEVLALSRVPGVDVLGFVADLAPVFERARVCVAPLRFGAGAKGKVGQSLVHGVPVVATRVGAEGMGLQDGINVLVADDPEQFALQVVRLLRDDLLWYRLQASGRDLARSAFSVEAVRGQVADLFPAFS